MASGSSITQLVLGQLSVVEKANLNMAMDPVP